jgi:hypothetical protein
MWRSVPFLAILTLLVSVPAMAPGAEPPRVVVATDQASATADSPVEGCQSPGAANMEDTLVQRSCCSGAGGFCGCSGGKMRCCNGDIAPACACRADTRAATIIQSRE